MQSNPQTLPVNNPSDMTCIDNLEHVLMHMGNQHFDLLYDDWAFDNRTKASSQSKEIVHIRAKRSISSMGDENLKDIETAFDSMGKDEALAALKALAGNIKEG